MGRPKENEYWDQVTRLGNDRWKCKHCGREFSGGASRIKAHVDRIEGKGIGVCKGSINHDQQQAVNGRNRGEVAEGVQGMDDANIGDSLDHQTNPESINLLGGPVPEQAVNQNYNTASGSEINQVNELIHDLTSMEGDIKEQLEWLESRGKKRKSQVDDWLNKLQNLKSRTRDMNDFVYHHPDIQRQGTQDLEVMLKFIEIQQLPEEVRKHKERKPLVLSKEFVGESFEKHVKKMWELLWDDQVFIIGIHGMGGVGKTCLATHMQNEIRRKGAFKHVFWVTISRDFSILKFQNDIAERIGAKLDGDDESTRAENLASALFEAKDKSLLILDDVWKNIDLVKVGIPIRRKGIKVILTSRLEHVFYQMNCSSDNIIRMYPLSEGEAWELFLLKLGDHEIPKTIPVEAVEIARSIARECGGLPLGLCVMARTMKGVNSIHRWRHTLNKLQNSVMGEEMKEEVFEVLKRSYDNLVEKGMQNCFFHCALYGKVSGVDLSMKLFDDGIKNGMRSLTEIFDEGPSILEELKGHSLLLKTYPWVENSHLGMHGLVRNMACHILKESHGCMVKCGKGLAKMPLMQEWTADLELVSLGDNNINEIPADLSRRCPRLSILILSKNSIRNIRDCFFTLMNTLTALDLSWNVFLTSLPDSVSDLRSLISLDIRGCRKLTYVPTLEKLQALSRLDISYTSVEEVRGLENLINLKWLNLSCNKQLKLTPGSFLPALTNLQFLSLSGAGSIEVKVEDVEGMGMLECFGGNFHDGEDYNNYVRTIKKGGHGPKTYHLLLGTDCTNTPDLELLDVYPRTVEFRDCQEFSHFLPTDIATLKITWNTQWISLCGTLLPTSHPSSLRNIEIGFCKELQSLFCSRVGCYLCPHIGNLESLLLINLDSLLVICKEEVAYGTSVPQLPNIGVFSHLKHFRISWCKKIETLLTPVLSSQLQNLETVRVELCDSVREIFAVNSSDGDDDGASRITLPKLTELKLEYLPNL